MKSDIFKYLGIENIDLAIPFIILLSLCVIFLVLIIILFVKIGKLNKRYGKFMQGKDGKSLENQFVSLFEDLNFLKNTTEKNRKDISHLYKLQEANIQKVGLKKYDAFQQMGGQLSYCLVLLDENDNGVLVNSVHSNEGCYSYIKEIKNGESYLPLGEEEKETLLMATGEK